VTAAAPVAAALLLALAVVNLVRRARASRWRAVAGIAGAAIGAGSLVLLDEAADERLSAHMLQHVLVGDLAPLLLVLALGGGVLTALPLASRLAAAAGDRPLASFAVWVVPIAVWHVPALYDAALAHERLHMFEHVTFAVGGVLVWNVLLDPARSRGAAGWPRFAYAVALLVPSQLLANLLIVSYRPLYPAYGSLADQDRAGLVMMAEQLATVGAFAAMTAWMLIRRPEPGPAAQHPFAV
jgi:cytochrome c oxidase assembly factor CtaG